MKICLAQTRPVKGNVEANITNHLQLIDLAIAGKANMIIFPELSLTGYEPTLAKGLATTVDDKRFSVFQHCSNDHQIVIAVGAPLQTTTGITISSIIFRPAKNREVYSKQFLHADEEPFFVSGKNASGLLDEKDNVALAICYELSVPAHAEKAFENGARSYLASVAKSVEGVEKATERLTAIAKQYSMMTMLVNCIGVNDGVLCAGRSSVWNKEGKLLGQLSRDREGLLFVDTDTEETNVQDC